MARIIGGIAASHTPTIGFAYDKNKQRRSGVGADLRELRAARRVARGEAARRAASLIYNDHITSFFFDHYSAFALGVGPTWHVADEGGGRARPAADRRGIPSSRRTSGSR